MSDSVSDQLRAIASDVLSVPVARLSMNTTPQDLTAWDSVQHVILLMAVEQHFSVTFTPDEMEQATSLGQIAAVVDRRLGLRSPLVSRD